MALHTAAVWKYGHCMLIRFKAVPFSINVTKNASSGHMAIYPHRTVLAELSSRRRRRTIQLHTWKQPPLLTRSTTSSLLTQSFKHQYRNQSLSNLTHNVPAHMPTHPLLFSYSQTFENKSSLPAPNPPCFPPCCCPVERFGFGVVAATGAALAHPPKSSSAAIFGGGC